MLRTIAGILAGIAVSVGRVLGLEALNHAIYPPLPGLDPMQPADAARLVTAMPSPAKMLIVFGWFLGSLLGGLVANAIARARWPAWIVAGLGIAGGVWTVMTIPHPLFMQLGSVAAPALAAIFASRSVPTPAGRGRFTPARS